MSNSIEALVPEDLRMKEIKWHTWINKAEGFLTKETHNTTMQEAIDELVKKTPQFLWHMFVKEQQSNGYAADKAKAQEDQSSTVLLQMDFAENYGVKYQVLFEFHIYFKIIYVTQMSSAI